MAEDYTQIPDLILEEYDELPSGKPRPAPPRPKQKVKKLPRQPAKPEKLPYGMQMKDVVESIKGTDPQSLRKKEIQRATAEYESKQIQYPEPHKFVPKKGPQVRLDTREQEFEQLLRGAEKRIDREKYEAKIAGQTAPGTGTQLLNRFGRGYVGSMTSMLKGPTLLNPEARTDPTTKFLYQDPQQQEQMLQTLLPVNKYDKSFHMRAAEALGGSVPFLMGGAAGRAVGMPGWLMSSALGAMSNAGSTYDDAIASGADEQSARLSSIVGALIGMTEGLGMGRMSLPGANKAAFATPLMQRLLGVLRHSGKEGVEEWAQETGSSILNNVNAKVLSGYDPKRAIQEGLWEAGLMGFTTGGLMGGAMKGATGVMNAMDPEYRAAKKEYMQVQALDAAFKKFMKEQEILHAAAANKGTPARIPPPQGYIPPAPKAPVGKALPSSGRMAPMADMALMSKDEDAEVPWYYSQLEKVVEEKFPDKMAVDQAMAMLTPYGSKYGIKQEEYFSSGLDELLARKAATGQSVTKVELLSTIKDAGLGIREVMKGGLAVNNEATQALRDDLADARVQIDQFRIHTNSLVRQQAELDKIFQEGGMEWEEYSGSIDKLSEQVRQNERESLDVQRRIAEMEDQLSTGVNDSRYESYKALAGGTPGSYRELLITLPKAPESLEPLQDGGWTTAGGLGDTANFYGGHFNEPNVLVHARLDEGTDADGNKVLRIQEIQSDWHQRGREKGYVDPAVKQKAFQKLKLARQNHDDAFANFVEAVRYDPLNDPEDFEISQLLSVFDNSEEGRKLNQQINEAHNELQPLLDTTIDAPFKQTWSDLAFKRLIRWAADKGYKRLVWTTGSQQIDLYQNELRRNVDRIQFKPQPGMTMPVGINNPDLDIEGTPWSQKREPIFGAIRAFKGGQVVLERPIRNEEELSELVGPAVAAKLIESGNVEGDDLSIGGQMHKLLYDQKLPQLARDYVRKYGGMTGRTQVRTDDNDTSQVPREPIYKTVHYLDLSPKLTETALQEGFPLYSKTDDAPIANAIDSMAFDVVPGTGGEIGNAPYMLVPRWAMTAMGEPMSTKGINWPYTKLGTILAQFRKAAPSPEHAKIATQALYELAEYTIDAGLNSMSFIPHGQTDEAVRGTIEHETFHAAMRAGLAPKLDWIRNYPGLREILNRPRTKEIQRGNKTEKITLPSLKESILSSKKGDDALMALAFEIPAHTVQGRLDLLGMSPSEGIDFLFDLYNHLRTEYGPEGIAKLRSLVRLRPEMLEAFDLAQNMWETWQHELRNGEGMVDEDVLYLDEEPMLGDNVVVNGAVNMGVFRVVDDSGDGSVKAVGPGGIVQLAKKGIRKISAWLNTEKGREVLENNPPAPRVPEEGPTSPPPPPRDPGGGAASGGESSFPYKEHLSPEAVQLLTRTYVAVLKEGGIEVDHTIAPFLQVVMAISEGKLHDVYIDEVMEREGIPVEEFARSMEETASDAGKVLQAYSEIARFWNTIIDEWEISEGIDEGGRGKPTGGKAGPRFGSNLESMYRAIPVDIRTRRALRGVNRTALGKSLWQRSGNVTQKAMLTQLSTFAVNTMTSTGQLPLRTVTYGLGGWMFQMAEGSGSLAQRFHHANEDMMHAMRASMEVVVAMNPWQFAQWAKGQAGSTKFQEYQRIIHQLERVFPDIKKKLFALSTGTETLKAGKKQLLLAQRLVPFVKDQAKRDKLLQDIKVFEERLEANGKAFGQLLNGTEVIYDFFLQPMQWTEYFLRRPMFVGQLTLELQREGHNLSQILATNQLSSIPEATMERAVNRALEFSYAYMPGTKTGTNYAVEKFVENASMKAIEWLNRFGGPLNALFGEAFAKAAFNGAKFVYEYSPVGGILPANRITKNWDLTQTVAQRNFHAWSGNAAAAAQIEPKGTYVDPVTNTMKITNPTNQEDYDRLAKAMVGTAMYAIVYFLRAAFGGPEWWQIDLGEKGPDGNPVYIDMRRHKPFSTLFQVVDLVERIATGKLGDIDVPAIIGEIVAGIRMYDNQMGGSIIESTADWFRHDEHQGTADRAQEEIGKAMAVYLTPLVNLRDCIAQWSEEENVKKDTRGSYSVMGPVMDKIPFLRRLLPNLTSPVEKSPIEMSRDPLLAQLTGYKTVEGQNFAGREWRRLGLYNRSFITRDKDPKINRAQNEAFEKMVGELAAKFEQDPAYQAGTDKQKLMLWELFIGGDGGFAQMAKEIGLIANPKEMLKRSMEQGSGMGRFTKEATGYNDMIKKTFEEK